MNMIRMAFFIVAFIAIAAGANQSQAGVFDLQLELNQQNGNGSRFSFLHTASGSGTNKSASGTTVRLNDGTNAIIGAFNDVTNILEVTGSFPSPLAHNSLTLSNGAVVTKLDITGGKFQLGTGGDGTVGGYLSYSALFTTGTTSATQTGNFYFANKFELGSVNGKDPNSTTWDGTALKLAVWGNNWTYSGVDWSFLSALGVAISDTTNASGNRMGMDLKVSGVAADPDDSTVPEPATAFAFGFGLLGLVVTGRRRMAKKA